ncbi:MAG: hypothetical protein D6746_11445 [Bacteroidetes bacterium]|nr:MAG: hypothetical protein D6746_11445 [Bacteroidota bacterium]
MAELVTKQVTMYHLVLNETETRTLMEALSHVRGSPITTYRKHTNAIRQALISGFGELGLEDYGRFDGAIEARPLPEAEGDQNTTLTDA